MIRPEVRAQLIKWRELGLAVLLAAIGLWFLLRGGWVLGPVGIALCILALAWGVIALRRMQFLRAVDAPGMVEVDEGQIAYLGPTGGGFVSLGDINELRLIHLYGAGHWRLRQHDGQVLLIPVSAAGADRLYDAFASLPGVDMAQISAALARHVDTLPLWRRDHALVKPNR